MDELSYRNIWVSLAIVLPIMALGMVLLWNDPIAREYLGVAAMFCGLTLLGVLDHRERRWKGLLPSQRQKNQRRRTSPPR